MEPLRKFQQAAQALCSRQAHIVLDRPNIQIYSRFQSMAIATRDMSQQNSAKRGLMRSLKIIGTAVADTKFTNYTFSTIILKLSEGILSSIFWRT